MAERDTSPPDAPGPDLAGHEASSPDGASHARPATPHFSAGVGAKDIVMAERAGPGAPFSRPALVPGLNTADDDENPTVTTDELVIVFASTRPGGKGGRDLWYAVRSATDEPFGEARPLPDLNTDGDESEPYLAPDCELFFAASPGGTLDLFVTRLRPGP